MAIETYKLVNGETRYRAVAFIGGHRVRQRGFKTKREAKKWIAVTEADGIITKPTTFRAVAEEWLEQYKPTVQPSTYNKTKTSIYHAIDHFGDINIAAITQADAQEIANEWSYQFVDFRKKISYTSDVFKYAIANEMLTKNPFEFIRRPKAHKKTAEAEIWTIDDLNKFLDACKEDKREILYPFFRLLAYTGMRRQEILALRWSDFDGTMIHIRRAVTVDYDNQPIVGDTKNKSSVRDLALDQGTIDALIAWKKFSTGSVIFPVSLHRPNKWMQQITEREHLPHCTPHKLRHLHCTILLQSGANLKDVQERLGHSDVQTTLSVYAHANKNKQLTADIFSNAVNQNSGK